MRHPLPTRPRPAAVVVFAAAAATLALLAGPAPADIVHVVGGRTLEGEVEEKGDQVIVKMRGGTVVLPRSRVAEIERVAPPKDAFAARFAALTDGDANAALALAADAERHGLADEAGRALERAAQWAPGDANVREASRRWRVYVRRLPSDPEADARLLSAAGPKGALHLTDHFRIAHDVEPAEARRRGELLEMAYRRCHELAAQMGIDARPIDRRLDVLVFATHARWVAAIGKPSEELRGMTGLYEPRDGRVYLFETGTSPEARETQAKSKAARAKLEAHAASLLESRRQWNEAAARGAAPDWSALEKAEAQAEADRRKIDEFDRNLGVHLEQENVATTTHEACHQLSFATGICRPGQPLWVLEGLATLFEITRKTHFVLDAPNEMRIADLRTGREAGRDTRIEDVVTDRVFLAPGADKAAAYADAWSLASFLSRRRTAQWGEFVREGRALPVAAESSAERLAEFRRVFGPDLAPLERDWKDDVRRLTAR